MEKSGLSSSRITGTEEEVPSRAVVRETGVSLSYPLLNKHNYNTWAIRMKVCKKAQSVWDAVVSQNPDEKKNQMAHAAIFQGVSDETLSLLGEKETTKEAWDTLKTTFVGADRVKEARAQTLKSEFERLHMKDVENIDDFAARLTSIVNQIRGLKEVIGRLKAYEDRVGGMDDTKDDQLLLTRTERKRGRGRARDSDERSLDSYKRDFKFDINKVRCFNFNNYGHYASDCRSKNNEQKVYFFEKIKDDEPALLMLELTEARNEEDGPT